MNIGIITFHASYNCGSILQCIALKKVLEDKKLKVDIINFSSLEQQKLYSVLYKKKTIKNIIKNILCIPGYKVISRSYDQYKDYIKKTFHINDTPFSTSDELKKLLPHYDMLIAGGDQIWNIKCDDFADAYMLDFNSDSYKISYSPSLGATDINTSPLKQHYRSLLLDFDDLSCREVNGAKWLKKITGREINLVLDPTMLLTRGEWRCKISEQINLPFKEDYIFYYAFSYSNENNVVIQKIAEQNDLKVVIIDAKQWYIKRLSRYKNFVLYDKTGPNAFLNLMNRAKYVITTSFHGTAFSLLFHKQFLYINGRKHESTDDRTSFLMDQLNITNRYIYSEAVCLQLLEEIIDYKEIDRKINELKKIAFDYLDSNIRRAEEGLKECHQ